MKLTVSRTMKRKGRFRELLFANDPSTFFRKIWENVIFKKSAVYYLDVDLDVTREEKALLKKNNSTWEYSRVCHGNFYGRSSHSLNLGDVLGKRTRWAFLSLNDLENFEGGLINGVKRLKQKLEELTLQKHQQIEDAKKLKQQAADFTSEGPREIDI